MTLVEARIGERVETLRKSKKLLIDNKLKYLSVNDLSKIIYIDIDSYDDRVKGHIPFSIKSLLTIANLYEVDANYLIFGGIK